MPDIFSITTSALQAFQTAIAVTSNNIANANTVGYSDESVNLVANPPQSNGTIQVGGGVDISGISRAYSQLAVNQYNTSQSSLGQLNALQTYTSQVDNTIGTTAGGLTTALQNYYNAWSTLANNPTSTADRQALLSQAQAVASSFQSTNNQLQNLNNSINTGLSGDVQQINSLTSSIASLNQQIVAATAGSGQAPNALLDQRGTLITNLSKLTGVNTSTNSDGSINVFTSNGTGLVVGAQSLQLTTVGNPFDASQLEIAAANAPTAIISNEFTSGDVGGLLAARTQAIQPAINQLGVIATALTSVANTQQASGLDLNGNFGAALFNSVTPQVVASGNNTGQGTVNITATNPASLTGDNYVLTYTGGAAQGGYTLTDTTTGSAVALSGAGTTASPFTAAGLTFTVTGVPAVSDQYLLEPTAAAAGQFGVALTSTSQIAAAGAFATTAAGTNTGTGSIAGTITNPSAYAAAQSIGTSAGPYTVSFAGTPANGYTVSNAAGTVASGTLAAGTPIAVPALGIQLSVSGSPANGDSFTIAQATTSDSGNNLNALANAAQQDAGVLQGGTVSIAATVNALVTGVGSQAQQVNTAQTAQAAINTQAQQSVQSVSGVDLDTEAANLLQYQQAYQAAAQALTIGNQLFTTLIDSVNGTYS